MNEKEAQTVACEANKAQPPEAKPVITESKQRKSSKSKKGLKPHEVPTSFINLEDGRIAEQIYNPHLDNAHQFITLNSEGFDYLPKIAIKDKVYIPAAKELVEKGVVLLPTEPIDYGSDSSLSDEIQHFIHRYLDIPLFYEKLSVLYAKYSWIHDQFSVTNYLRARGDYGCGKSRLLQTVGAVAYKPMFCGGSTTSSPIFRLMELFKGTLVLDEADFKHTDLYMDLIKILNQGYMKGIFVLRTEGGSQKWEMKPYDVCGCKIIATRKKYQD
jgi:hypothetical protein